MWIIAQHGFISLVQDRNDSSMLQVRARVKADIENLFPGAEVITKPGADYCFRARLPRAEVAAAVWSDIMTMDYTGHSKDVAIRSSATPEAGSRSTAYYACWNALALMQPYAPYSKVPRATKTVAPAHYASEPYRFQNGDPEWLRDPAPSSRFGPGPEINSVSLESDVMNWDEDGFLLPGDEMVEPPPPVDTEPLRRKPSRRKKGKRR